MTAPAPDVVRAMALVLKDAATLQAWLGEIDDVRLQALVIKLCAEVIESDDATDAAERALDRAAFDFGTD